MKKRRVFLCLTLTAWCLTGCQKTPDQQIVREKGKDSIAQYEQDTEQENVEDTDRGTGQIRRLLKMS